MIQNKQIDPSEINKEDPLGFLLHDNGAESIVDAAYRFCNYEEGTHVILSGTGNLDHLKENIRIMQKPPLPKEDIIKLTEIFRNVDSITGQ